MIHGWKLEEGKEIENGMWDSHWEEKNFGLDQKGMTMIHRGLFGDCKHNGRGGQNHSGNS